jgi:hypothetical protein
MATNGCWVADATGDTMQNGGDLLPNSFSASWCDTYHGLPLCNTSVFLPHPSDSNLVYLMHQSGTSSSNPKSTGLFYSLIDKTLNNGLGGVVAGQKNIPVFMMGLNPGMAVCRHANGRDWWIVTMKDSSNIVYASCLTPTGFTAPIVQTLNFSPAPLNQHGQMCFSSNGEKFAYIYSIGTFGAATILVRITDFDRCFGSFSNNVEVTFPDPSVGTGLCFSPNSKLLYACTSSKIVQLNVDTNNIAASLDTVAVNDGYYSPFPPLQSDFWMMSLSANGKIYLSSGNSVLDLHYINYPDSDGVACDVQQHAVHLPCFAIRGQIFHPNYYLGCDTTSGCACLTSTGVGEFSKHDFKAKISPNPGLYGFRILYLLPQNKSGILTVYDMQGREMYKENLPPWSTLQTISASSWPPGIYQIQIESAGYTGSWKWVKY